MFLKYKPAPVWADCDWSPAARGPGFHRAAAGPWAGSAANTDGGAVPSLRPGSGSQHCTAAGGPGSGPSALSDPESLYFSVPAEAKETMRINTKRKQKTGCHYIPNPTIWKSISSPLIGFVRSVCVCDLTCSFMLCSSSCNSPILRASSFFTCCSDWMAVVSSMFSLVCAN